ncbi:PKD domain-containing protein [Pontibacter toksunensis]|uniref:PKD domain-containing protein n=1 Tax=Pontibacter toksunensis TaxID=1332631 RepID=A0ABW6BS25_9BACT
MKTKSSYSRLIDERVFLSMLVCAIIALTVLGFRFKSYKPCNTIEISVKQGPIYAGELIQFKAVVSHLDKRRLQWDFGDEGIRNKEGITASHIFKKPGRYEVNLNVDKICSAFRTVYVLEAPPVVDESSKPVFSGPLSVEVGAPAVFVDSTLNAKKWEWRFGETNGVDATKQRVVYTFKTTGTKKVLLTVNEKMLGELMVLVTPQASDHQMHRPIRRSRPRVPNISTTEPNIEPSEPANLIVSRMPDVTQEQLQDLIKKMVEGEKDVTDLAAHFCENPERPINYNEEQMSLDNLYKELRKIKKDQKIKELKIDIEKDVDTNCIKSMTVKLKRKTFLGL